LVLTCSQCCELSEETVRGSGEKRGRRERTRKRKEKEKKEDVKRKTEGAVGEGEIREKEDLKEFLTLLLLTWYSVNSSMGA
jgi:hypothetical protein